MLEQLFTTILSISIASSCIAIPFYFLRICFGKKIRKNYFYVAWCFLFLRLVLPWGLPLSMPPLAPTTQNVIEHPSPQQETTTTITPPTEPAPLATTPKAEPPVPSQKVVILLSILQKLPLLWLVGMLLCFLRYGISYIRLAKGIKTAFLCHEKTTSIPVYISDSIDQPFIFGLFSPHIYIPQNLIQLEKDISPIILHETIHIQRKDHWIQAIAFLILCIHWFNPLVHIAFYMLQKDMEMSCDEKVLSSFQQQNKQEYATLLLDCAIAQTMGIKPSIYYVAFGENSIRSRIKNILAFHNQKKSISILSFAFVAVFVVILAIQPLQNNKISNKEPFGILLLGKIESPYDTTDAFLAVVLDTEKNTVELTPISRDLALPSKEGKLSTFAANGYTEEEITKYLAHITGLPLQAYAAADIATFEKAIDAMGGIDFTIPQDMIYQDPYQDLYIYLQAGEQHLNGEQTGHLVRFRRYPEGALQREKTIANVFQTIATQLTEYTSQDWNALLSIGLEKDITTNLTLPQCMTVWETMKELQQNNISIHLLEYNTITQNGIPLTEIAV